MTVSILQGDNRARLAEIPECSVNTCVTSPPYFGLRAYLPDGHADKEKEIGIEQTPEQYVESLVEVFRGVRRALRDDGTLWLNLGDSYYNYRPGGHERKQTIAKTNQDNPNAPPKRNLKYEGIKEKDLIGIPWMVAFALRADGWYLRQDIIWNKKNPMPESVEDRCTKAHEYIFLLSKQKKYYFDHESIKVPVKDDWGTRDRTDGKYHNEGTGLTPHSGLEKSYEMANKRSVWNVATASYAESHFATFPAELIMPCILAGSPEGGMVLDPFGGAGTTGLMAHRLGRSAVLIELNEKYVAMAQKRISGDAPLFDTAESVQTQLHLLRDTDGNSP